MEQPALSNEVGTRLGPWRDAIARWVQSDWPELTNRQLGLLLIICLEPERHPVRTLATRLGVSKPIISRVMDRLADLDMMIRETDRRDRRNVFAVPTPRAFDFLTEFHDMMRIDETAQNHLSRLTRSGVEQQSLHENNFH